MALLLCAFLVSAAAPGNQVRGAQSEGTTALYAITHSLITAIQYIKNGLTISHLLAMAFAGVILWRIAGNTSFRFPFPLLVGALSYGLYAAQFCPTLYAQNYAGPGRLQNIIYDMFLLLCLLNLFYVMGWLRHRKAFHTKERRGQGYPAAGLALIGAAFLLCCSFVPRDTPITVTRAVHLMRSGEAEAYYQEFLARCEILEDTTQEDAVIPAYTLHPYLLFFDDATEDPNDWRNQSIANYYGKRSVVVQNGS